MESFLLRTQSVQRWKKADLKSYQMTIVTVTIEQGDRLMGGLTC
jgi:hypothetical protein